MTIYRGFQIHVSEVLPGMLVALGLDIFHAEISPVKKYTIQINNL